MKHDYGTIVNVYFEPGHPMATMRLRSDSGHETAVYCTAEVLGGSLINAFGSISKAIGHTIEYDYLESGMFLIGFSPVKE